MTGETISSTQHKHYTKKEGYTMATANKESNIQKNSTEYQPHQEKDHQHQQYRKYTSYKVAQQDRKDTR